MILTITNILLSFLLTANSNQKVNINDYLKQHCKDCSRIEYSIVSPQGADLSRYKIDETRKLKITGNYAYLPTKIFNENGSSKNTLITLKLKIYKNVLVANRLIKKKEYLNSGDFRSDEKEISTLRYSPVNTSLAINNFRSKRKISEDAILETSMLERIPDVEIGDRVEAVLVNNSVKISFNVTARSEGVVGNVIKVKNDDKKIFKAKIINNSTVKIIE